MFALFVLSIACGAPDAPAASSSAPSSEPAAAQSVESLIPGGQRIDDKLVVGGQPSQDALQAYKDAGFTTIINLRTPGEMRFDEAGVVQGLGMTYVNIPVGGASDINPENAAKVQELIASSQGQVLLHCASGNRVGQLRAVMN
ncbi:MAG: sulfur transferase domain-containing protein [Myxococcota bacterium]|nr:sulfur transferase domain-containing protein [Myxococcota bacterium]